MCREPFGNGLCTGQESLVGYSFEISVPLCELGDFGAGIAVPKTSQVPLDSISRPI